MDGETKLYLPEEKKRKKKKISKILLSTCQDKQGQELLSLSIPESQKTHFHNLQEKIHYCKYKIKLKQSYWCIKYVFQLVMWKIMILMVLAFTPSLNYKHLHKTSIPYYYSIV